MCEIVKKMPSQGKDVVHVCFENVTTESMNVMTEKMRTMFWF